MKAAARREEILKYLEVNHMGYTADLCQVLNVSAMTIRRDLEFMAGQGLVTLIRGGAAINHGTAVIYSLKFRQTQLPLEKQRIAQRCAAMVSVKATRYLLTAVRRQNVLRRLCVIRRTSP